jgi:hypothetical protein
VMNSDERSRAQRAHDEPQLPDLQCSNRPAAVTSFLYGDRSPRWRANDCAIGMIIGRACGAGAVSLGRIATIAGMESWNRAGAGPELSNEWIRNYYAITFTAADRRRSTGADARTLSSSSAIRSPW